MTPTDNNAHHLACARALGMLQALRESGFLLPTFCAQADEIIAAAEAARKNTAEAIAANAIEAARK
jgi:hypothetical protein